MISFETTPQDGQLIQQIVDRMFNMHSALSTVTDRMSVTMDITACHANGCPLKLAALLEADPQNFAHDTVGIFNHMDRKTGKLKDCFLPRYAK